MGLRPRKTRISMVVRFKHIEKWTIITLKTQKEGFDSPTENMKLFSNKSTEIFSSICYMIFLFFFISCKEDKSETETKYVDQETKDFVAFKPGSWWVYQNSQTNEIDTWKLISRNESIANADEANIFNTEKIHLTIYTILNDTFQYTMENFGANFRTSKYFGLVQPAYFENGTDKIGSCDNNYIKIIKRDSFNGQCIRREFGLYPEPCTTKFPIYTKWERFKGLIKFAYKNGDTFNIINHKVEQ